MSDDDRSQREWTLQQTDRVVADLTRSAPELNDIQATLRRLAAARTVEPSATRAALAAAEHGEQVAEGLRNQFRALFLALQDAMRDPNPPEPPGR